MRASRRTEKSVKDVIEHLAEAYERRDIEAFRRLIAPDPDVVLFGTGVDEKRVGWKQIKAQIERDWAQSDTARMRFDSLNISSAGSSACAAASGHFDMTLGDDAMSMPMRFTTTLENRAGKWVVVQMHFSTPMQAPEGQSFLR